MRGLMNITKQELGQHYENIQPENQSPLPFQACRLLRPKSRPESSIPPVVRGISMIGIIFLSNASEHIVACRMGQLLSQKGV